MTTETILKRSASFFLWFTLSAIAVLPGCKKKDRLSTNSYQLVITPSATSVAKNNPRSFTVEAVAPNGTFAVEPTWQVLESTSGAQIIPNVGTTVSVTFPNLGVYNLVANYSDQQGRAQVRVESATSPVTAPPIILPSSAFLIYTDAGLPPGADIYVASGLAFTEKRGMFDGAHGASNYLEATNMTTGSWFSIDLKTSSVNLSDYHNGFLRFSIRKNRAFAGDNLKIEMHTPTNDINSTATNQLTWKGFTGASTDWQDVSIDLNLFFGGAGPVQAPFVFVASASSGLTVDIDNVRLEKN